MLLANRSQQTWMLLFQIRCSDIRARHHLVNDQTPSDARLQKLVNSIPSVSCCGGRLSIIGFVVGGATFGMGASPPHNQQEPIT